MSVVERRFCALLAIACAAGFLLLSEGAISGSDGESMFETTKSMITDRDLTIRSDLGIPGRGGHTYSRLGIGLPLVSIPAYVGGAAVGSLVGHRDAVESAAVSATVPITCALLVVALYSLGRRLGGTPSDSAVVAVATILGTFALAYTKEFFSEPLATLGLVLCLERFLANRLVTSSLALVVAVATRPQLAVLFPFLIIAIVSRDRSRRTLISVAAVCAAGGALVGGYNVMRFGGLLSFGYQDFGFRAPQLTALAAFIASPVKSLILFAPIVVVIPHALAGLRRSHREAVIGIVAIATAVVGVTVCVAFWDGGWSWGPRYLYLMAIPASASLAPHVASKPAIRRLVFAAFLVGFAVSASTLIVSTRAQQLDEGRTQPNPLRQLALVPRTVEYTTGHLYDYTPNSGDYYKSAQIWQVGATRLLGRKGLAVAALGSAVLLSITALAARRAASALKALEGPKRVRST